MTSNGRQHPTEYDLQWKMFHSGESGEILEEILSVALLSPACIYHIAKGFTPEMFTQYLPFLVSDSFHLRLSKHVIQHSVVL